MDYYLAGSKHPVSVNGDFILIVKKPSCLTSLQIITCIFFLLDSLLSQGDTDISTYLFFHGAGLRGVHHHTLVVPC